MTAIALSHSTSIRRRRTLNEPSKKATFQLRESVYEAVRALAEAGVVPSMSVLVEQALVQRIRELRRERLYAAYDEAASDPVFLAESDETTRAFEHTVGDGLAEEVKV